MCFTKTLSQSLACLFILLTVSFTEQKFYTLIKFSLSIISFMGSAFGVVSVNSLPNLRSPKFFLMLSFRSFIVLCFIFRSIIHFELIFVKGVASV